MKRGVETSLYFDLAALELTDERAKMMGLSRSDIVAQALEELHGRQAISRRWQEIMRRQKSKGGSGDE